MSLASTTEAARALARRDPALAAALAALAAAAALLHGLTWLEAAGLAALFVPLAWRRRRPLAVLGMVAGGAVAYLALALPSPAFIVPVAVALYTVGAHGSRRTTLAVAAALVPAVAVVVGLFSPEDGSALRQTLEELSQLGLALVVGVAVRNRRESIQADRERAAQAVHEQEIAARRRMDEQRMRIARDVHDVVAHSLATISTQASVGVHLGRRDPERAVEVLESVKALSARALHDLRHALGVLRDGPGDGTSPTPSVRDVSELVAQARSAGVAVDLRMEGSPAALPAALQAGVYRIVQEGLTNVMRHADGARVIVRVAVADQDVEVEVIDDGTGTPTSAGASGPGSGLAGMRERASALGGAFEAGRRSDGGFGVRAAMPVDRDAA